MRSAADAACICSAGKRWILNNSILLDAIVGVDTAERSRRPCRHDAPDARCPVRDRIKEAATILLIKEGYRGFLFRDVATGLKITRANIHYHFGNKTKLVEEVIHDYMQKSIAGHEKIWITEGLTLRQRLDALRDFNRGRYKKQNPKGRGGTFSLISRMRRDKDLLTPKARKEVMDFADQIEGWVRHAVDEALRNGELRADAPREDVAVVLFALTNTAASITEEAGSLEKWEAACNAAARLIEAAYGKKS